MPERILLAGARVVDPAADRDEVLDVLVADGRVASVERAASREGATVIDCSGLVLAPGLVDLHAHLREPGREDKETVETGTRAAAVGGYTAVTAMANTDPVADNAAVIREVLALAERARLADVFPRARSPAGSRASRWRSSARWSRRGSGSSPTTGGACRRRARCATRSST